METIGSLARRFGLSRSSLLYYNRIGLLQPSGRSRANYRLYSQADARRLSRICMYREAGVPLLEIKKILDTGGKTVRILQRRLEQLNEEISRFREQQRVILGLLKNRTHLRKTRTLDKQRWVEILRASGLSDDDMDRWHFEFERMSPEAHHDFLEALGIPAAEVAEIRRWCKQEIRRK
jgi:DNA-binding transcriptional MerR regulator